jgi:hypothetical protein
MRRRALPRLVGAVGISTFGDMPGLIPIVLHVQDRSGSGLAVAETIGFALGPFAGGVLAASAGCGWACSPTQAPSER